MNARVVWLGGLSAILALAAAYLHLSPGEAPPGMTEVDPIAVTVPPVPAAADVLINPAPSGPSAVETVNGSGGASGSAAHASAVVDTLRAASSAGPESGMPSDSARNMGAQAGTSLSHRGAVGEARRKPQHHVSESTSREQHRALAAEKARRRIDAGIAEPKPTRPARVLAEEGDRYVSPARGVSPDGVPDGRVWVIPHLQDQQPSGESPDDFERGGYGRVPLAQAQRSDDATFTNTYLAR